MGTRISEIDNGCTRGELENSDLSVTNIVATVDLEREFDLTKLATSMPKVDYDPEISPFLLFKSGAITVMVPRTGKLSIVGARTVQDINEALVSLIEAFDEIEVQINKPELKIQNIVINGRLDQEIVLEAVVLELGMERTEYEPEQFPGLIYRIRSNATVLLFQSGRFVITGVTNYNEAHCISTKLHEDFSELIN